MKFALHNGERKEAEINLKGAVCQVCKAEVIAKCGDVKIHHWAHKSKRKCDHWWENETKWHRDWKNQFSKDWQEVVHSSETGERHIADIKTPKGLVVEFQHSPIKPEEILARNTFYKNIIWIVDGKRRKYDEKKFKEVIDPTSGAWEFWYYSPLLRDWSRIQKPVFFDFGGPKLYVVFEGEIKDFDKVDFIEAVKMGGNGKTLLHLLKEKTKIAKIKDEYVRNSIKEKKEKRTFASVRKRGY